MALKEVWSDVNVHLCLFHLLKSWKERAAKAHLFDYFKVPKSNAQNFWLCLKGSVYLDLANPLLLDMAIDVLKRHVNAAKKDGDREWCKLNDYFKTYILRNYMNKKQNARTFDPVDWASCNNEEIVKQSLIMTTNSAESMHAQLR